MDNRIPVWFRLAMDLHHSGCAGWGVTMQICKLLNAGFLPRDEDINALLPLANRMSCCSACWRVADLTRPQHAPYREKMLESARHHYASALVNVRSAERAGAFLALSEEEQERTWEENSRGEQARVAADYEEGLRMWDEAK